MQGCLSEDGLSSLAPENEEHHCLAYFETLEASCTQIERGLGLLDIGATTHAGSTILARLEFLCKGLARTMLHLHDPVSKQHTQLVQAQKKSMEQGEQVKRLQEKLAMFHRQKMSMTEELRDLDEAKKSLEIERRRVTIIQGSRQDEEQGKAKLIEELEQMNASMQVFLEESKNENARLNTLMGERDLEISDLQRQLDEQDKQREVETLQREAEIAAHLNTLMGERDLEISDLQRQLDEQDKQREVETLQREAEIAAHLNTLMSERDLEISDLQQQLDEQDKHREVETLRREAEVAERDSEMIKAAQESKEREQFLEMSLNCSIQDAYLVQGVQVLIYFPSCFYSPLQQPCYLISCVQRDLELRCQQLEHELHLAFDDKLKQERRFQSERALLERDLIHARGLSVTSRQELATCHQICAELRILLAESSQMCQDSIGCVNAVMHTLSDAHIERASDAIRKEKEHSELLHRSEVVTGKNVFRLIMYCPCSILLLRKNIVSSPYIVRVFRLGWYGRSQSCSNLSS